MIFGSKRSFGIELAPREPAWPVRSPGDRGPWAALTIWSCGKNLTEAVCPDDGRHSAGVDVPLACFADWLVAQARALLHEEFPSNFGSDLILHQALDRWNLASAPPGHSEQEFEDARYEWYCRHFLAAGCEGAIIPDLAFARIDGRFWLAWRQPQIAGPRQLCFTTPPGFDHHEWDSAWGALCAFVDFVAEGLRERGVSEFSWASGPGALEAASCISGREFVRLVAPNAMTLVEQLGIAGDTQPDASPALQALRDLSFGGPGETELVLALRRMNETGESRVKEELATMRAQFASNAGAASPEEAGYAAAGAFRSALRLNGEALDTRALAGWLREWSNIEELPTESARNNFAVGMTAGHAPHLSFFVHARTRRPCARRMEYARALGHLLLDPENRLGVFGAASSQCARGPRRRRSGAFAAELLMPLEGIRQFLGSLDASEPAVFESLLRRFEAGATMAAFHLWNRDILQSSEERDALIEEFAWRDRVPEEPAPRHEGPR